MAKEEDLLLLTKSGLLIQLKSSDPEKTRPESVIVSRRRKHSEKPDEIYDIIEKKYPSLKKIELFARKKHEGWQCWVNEE